MDAQKRKGRVWNRIDEMIHQGVFVRSKGIILTSKRDNLQCRLSPGQACNPITLETATVNDRSRPDRIGGSFYNQLTVSRDNLLYLLRAPNLTPSFLNQGSILLSHPHIVDNPCLGDVQGSDAGGVRFNFPQPLGTDHFQPRNTVGRSAPVEFLKPRELVCRGCHNDFPTAFIGDIVLIAKFG